jgi:hypothetical protein
MSDARRAIRAAQKQVAASDAATATVMVASARSRLGLIDERYGAPSLADDRTALRAADRKLADAQTALRERRPDAQRRLAAWLADAGRLETELEAAETKSLFNPARLAQALKRRLPG